MNIVFFSFQLLGHKNYLKSGFFNPKYVTFISIALFMVLPCEFCSLYSSAVEDSIRMRCDAVSPDNEFPTFLLGSRDP
jgi:hypothetical protein